MVNNFDTPWDFQPIYRNEKYEVVYSQLNEINQGSPLIGKLIINNVGFGKDMYFGGPFLIDNDKLYIPLFVRKFCITGFRLCEIELQTMNYNLIGRILPLIFLDRIENKKIFYWINAEKQNADFFVL
ncbi:hypothetical protein [Pinibacter aurantiacus]|uniref:Uncharacterized protein n=1 Tax=Pinibacter aurantiacus TaxID=2851599 RepID=A0A9E2W578_9BACT|nr:hypothetical protein [Pinibacter aurantiacus]MBV4358368.1 hypothetical protein [Pinibacter aurantiacus]